MCDMRLGCSVRSHPPLHSARNSWSLISLVPSHLAIHQTFLPFLPLLLLNGPLRLSHSLGNIRNSRSVLYALQPWTGEAGPSLSAIRPELIPSSAGRPYYFLLLISIFLTRTFQEILYIILEASPLTDLGARCVERNLCFRKRLSSAHSLQIFDYCTSRTFDTMVVFCAYCGKSFTRKEHLERHIPSRKTLKEMWRAIRI